jgi:hypothetical protein
MEAKVITRRSFLAGASLMAVAGTTAAITACTAETIDEETKTKTAWLPAKWDYETDVLVIGYGGAGLWAALTAKDEFEVDVLCLEKAPERGGGNSSINMGEFTWVDDVDKAVRYIKEFSKGLTPEDIARAWAEECYRNLDYADHWGVPAEVMKGSHASGGTSSCEYPYLDGAEALYDCSFGESGNGNSGWKQLDSVRAELGIDIIFSCHDETLIQNPETREIVGCYTLIGNDATPKAVKARKGVILTLGGFEFNDELKNTYLKCYPMNGFYGWPFNTGDGIKMVQEVGAQLWNMNAIIGGECAWFKDAEQPYAFMLFPLANNYIKLDRLGNRWIDEMYFLSPHNGWHYYEKFNDDDICDFERIPTWIIMDRNCIDAGPLGPVASGTTMTPGGLTYVGMSLNDVPESCGHYAGWSQDNQTEIDAGWILEADTIEDLVKKMQKVDNAPSVEAVVAAVAKYNSYCDEGNDPDFNRAPETLVPVSTPPYYAYPLYPGTCSTLGGAKKNAKANVLDVTDQPIPRLYAGGCFGNMARHTYGLTGGNNAENMVWGRIAGRSAASLDSWEI